MIHRISTLYAKHTSIVRSIQVISVSLAPSLFQIAEQPHLWR